MFGLDRARLGDHLATHDPIVDTWLRDEVLLGGGPLGLLIDHLEVGARS